MKADRRYSPTEDFFYDKQFSRLLKNLSREYDGREEDLLLIFNGDVFDFLTVTKVPPPDEAKSRGFAVSPQEQKFGLNPSAKKSVYKLDVIVAGHKVFFRALANFISDGFRVVILPGNHDIEQYFPEVRRRLIEHLSSFDESEDLERVEELVEFKEWFYFEPGRVYIEHGNQYESTNSVRFPLRPLLSGGLWWAEEDEDMLDYPLGSIFVRFFYNRVRRLDPYTPRLISFEQYLDFIRRYNIFDVWRVYRDHYPYFVQALSPTVTSSRRSRTPDADEKRQVESFRKLKETNENGYLYEELSSLKVNPASASKPYVVKEMMTPFVRRALWFSLFAFAVVFVWVGAFQLIDDMPSFPAKTFLTSLFAVATLGLGFWVWAHLQRKLKRRTFSSLTEQYVEHAEKIAKVTGVPLILMGHTHRVDYRLINQAKAVYANGGTWTSVENPWSRIMRDARRLTFLYVKGSKVELCRWNDDAGRIDDVPLFFLEGEHHIENTAMEKPRYREARKEHSWLPSSDVLNDHDYDTDD